MLFTSYIDLLNAVDKDGELVSPSNVSTNRSFETKELTNVQLKIDDFKQLIVNDKEVEYLEKELDWYLGNIKGPEYHTLELTHEPQIKNKLPVLTNFNKILREMALSHVGCVNRAGPNSNYGEMCLRLKNHIGITQKDWILFKLQKDPSSRQAIAFYNSPNYQYYSNDDFVCTLTQMFNIKDNKLNTTVNIRSNDLINCFRFDILWYRKFQTIIFEELKKTYSDLQLGYVFCNIFSAHYYLKDEKKLEEIRECEKNNSYKKVGEKYL